MGADSQQHMMGAEFLTVSETGRLNRVDGQLRQPLARRRGKTEVA